MTESVFRKVEQFLKSHAISYRVLEHEPSGLSSEVSKVREKLTGIQAEQLMKMAVKSMIVKSGGKLSQFNLAADKKIDFTKVKELLGAKAEFATPEEVTKHCDCAVGEVPPFGNLFSLSVYADSSINTDEILFNAGMLTKTIFMKRADWIRTVNPHCAEYSK